LQLCTKKIMKIKINKHRHCKIYLIFHIKQEYFIKKEGVMSLRYKKVPCKFKMSKLKMHLIFILI